MSRAYALALVLLLSASGALAAPSEAEKLYTEGLELLKQGDVSGAVARFERALEVEPSAPLWFNVGQAQAKLGRLLDAKRSFEQALRLAEERGPKRIVPLAKDALAETDARIPRVVVELPETAQGARIELDGKPIEVPDTGALVDPGKHELAIEAEGYRRFAQSFEVKERETKRIRPGLERDAQSAAPAEPSQPDQPAERSLVGPLILGGVGLAALGGATYFYLRMGSIEDERRALWADSGCPGPSCPDGEPARAGELREDSERHALFGNVLAVAGGAALVGAGVWYFLSGKSDQREAGALIIAPAPGGATVAGSF